MTGDVALLQGVNVGGQRKVPMADLREVAASLGWSGARTHLNSGNCVFRAATRTSEELAGELSEALAERFGFQVPCLVRSAEELRDVMLRCPYDVRDLDPAKLLVYFLDARPSPDRLATVDQLAFMPEEFEASGREIYCYFPDGMGRSKLAGALGKAFSGCLVTSRNWRTVSRLAELVD